MDEKAPEDIQLLVGPLLLGYLFNYGLYGILVLQTYIYYLSFPKDAKLIKSLVYVLFSFDTIQTIMTTHNAWHFLASGWGDMRVLSNPGWSWIAVPLFSGLVSSTVQLFFSWRIWKLSGFWWLATFISCAALAQGISAIITGIWFAILDDITKISRLDATAGVWLAGSAITDLLITISLVWVLHSKSQGGLSSSTEDVISRIIRLTVQTGAVTTLAATAELIMYLRTPQNNLHMIPGLALSKLYTNTLMATLNSRSGAFNTSQSSRFNAEGGISQPRASRRATTHHNQKSSPRQIEVITVQETMTDGVQMVNLPVNRPTGRHITVVETDVGSDDDDGKAYAYSLGGEEKRRPDLESGPEPRH